MPQAISEGASGFTARAKASLKRVLSASPALKNNRAYYEIQRRRATRGIGLRPELTDRPDLLNELDDKGIVVVRDYMSPDEAAHLLAASEETLQQARDGALPESTFHGEAGILLRLADADHHVPETGAFFSDPMIQSLFKAYMSPEVVSYRHEFDYRYGLADVGLRQSDLYHFDNWLPICKAFLYLTDVTEDHAPFVYMPGTHKPAPWRRRHEMQYDAYGPTGPYGYFFPAEINELRRRYGLDDVVCTGPAGTLILADFRGLHRGTPMRAGRRVLLNNTFDRMNPELNYT